MTEELLAHGPFINDVYVPPRTLPFLPGGGNPDYLTCPGYSYFSLRDSAGVERELEVYLIGPDQHGYRVHQVVEYGEGDPLDPDTERIPDSLETHVEDFGRIGVGDLRSAIAIRHPNLKL